jgi:hypothetical protein
MEWVIFALVIIFFFYRVIKANFEDRIRDANDELQEYYDSLAENDRIDNALDDERVQHVQDKFND